MVFYEQGEQAAVYFFCVCVGRLVQTQQMGMVAVLPKRKLLCGLKAFTMLRLILHCGAGAVVGAAGEQGQTERMPGIIINQPCKCVEFFLSFILSLWTTALVQNRFGDDKLYLLSKLGAPLPPMRWSAPSGKTSFAVVNVQVSFAYNACAYFDKAFRHTEDRNVLWQNADSKLP